MYFYIVSIIFMLSSIFNLIMLHVFVKSQRNNKKVNIPEVLPDFIINWLKDFEVISKTRGGTEYFKNEYYMEIGFCFLAIIITTLIF